jgi:DNA primase
MAFPPQFLDELRHRVSLSSLVGRKVKLQRAGREWRAPCPFHQEKTPSFYVNDQKGFFHCFGCGAHGDSVGFIMRHDNLSFVEAVEALAVEAGMEVPKPTEQERQRYEQQKTLHEVLETATQYFEAQLHEPAGRQALDYLRGRGLSDETISSFRLGYAPPDGQTLRAALLAKNCSEADLLAVGLLRKAEDGRVYSFFRDRAIFPVGDRRGRPVAFGARILNGEGPKYINSPEHELFHKGETLYGLAKARQAAADERQIIVAEGYMDVIALNQAGFSGAVAPMGTALTEAQIETLWKLIPVGVRAPVLCLDGDKAGQAAAQRAVERVLPLLKPDHTLKIAFLPKGEDPDSLVKTQGKAKLAEVIAQAIPLVEMLWQSTLAAKPGRTPEEIAGLRVHLLERAARIANADVRHAYEHELRKRLDDTFQPRRGFTSAAPRQKGKNGRYVPLPVGPKPSRRPSGVAARRAELVLLALLNHPYLFDEFGDQLHDLDCSMAQQGFHRVLCEGLAAGHTGEILRRYLHDQGHGETLADLTGPRLRHMIFAKPNAVPEEVRLALIDILELGASEAIRQEIKAVAGTGDDEAAHRRVTALHRQLHERRVEE